MLRRSFACGLAVLCGVLVSIPSRAAEPANLVATDPAQADEDFPLQGEYRGTQSVPGLPRSAEAIGVQVIALGGGEFQAWKYFGGLPGSGWDRRGRTELTGMREGRLLELEGQTADIVIENGRGRIYDPAGRVIGEVHKVQRVSPTLGAAPPEQALVLFDGASTEHFAKGKLTAEGCLLAGADTVRTFGDFRLHGEFRLPYKPYARGQDRGNSGFYLQTRYEVQVLDSFGLEGVENECGALYRTRRPDLNMCLPPLQWQTYDIDFQSARFDASGQKVQDMTISIWHNGVLIHDRVSIPKQTGAGQPEGPHPLPIRLQEHGNPVVYRNLWLVETTGERPAASELPIPVAGEPTPIGSHLSLSYPWPAGTVVPSFGPAGSRSY